MAYPTLNQNRIFGALYNQIISQQVFSDNIAGTNAKLVDAARVDGSLYGDTKIYYATDALTSKPWGADAEATNLLALHRPAAPSTQVITLDVFRQISVTVDNYLTKQAFADEYSFGQFNSVILGWIQDTKRIYDSTTYNAFIGTLETQIGKQSQSISLANVSDENRAKKIAEKIANIMVEMTDVTRDYNDYGYLRSYNESDIKVVWNSKYVNEIKKIDLPTIFHNEGLMEKFAEYVLPARFFGEINASQTAGDGSTVRSLIEQEISGHHYFAGDLIATSDTAPAGTSYTEEDDQICKIFVKLPPLMSSFETGSTFWNPKSLTENHYLTFGRNTLVALKNYPAVSLYEDS